MFIICIIGMLILNVALFALTNFIKIFQLFLGTED